MQDEIELMTGSLATFELFAELSIALAGFSGVASAFGGRGREFSRIEKTRIDAIFQFSSTSLAASLLVLTLSDAGVSPDIVYSIACAVSGVLIFLIFTRQFPKVLELYRNAESTTSSSFLVFTFSYLLGLSAAYFWAAIFVQASWPLFAGLSSQLIFGLWMFARFLLRAR